MSDNETTTVRPLYVIADDIRAHWPRVNFAAVPYLEALTALDKVTDSYFQDSAKSMIQYFLANASSWRGDDAKRIKNELKVMIGQKPTR